MQWRLRGLERSPYVEDVSILESRKAYMWLDSLYRKLKQISCEVIGVADRLQWIQDNEGETEEKVIENIMQISRSRSQSF